MKLFQGLGDLKLSDNYEYIPLGEFTAKLVNLKRVESKKVRGQISIIAEIEALESDRDAKEGKVYSHSMRVTGPTAEYGLKDFKSLLAATFPAAVQEFSAEDWENFAEEILDGADEVLGEAVPFRVRCFEHEVTSDKSKHVGKVFNRVRFTAQGY